MLSLSKFIEEIRSWTTSNSTVEAFRTKAAYFTRNTAKLSFGKLFSFILGNNRSSAQVALNDFFRDSEDEPVAKQTLFEAREKISYEAFVALNNLIVDKFYNEGNAKTYKSYTLIGVDGSLFQAPQGALETFGGQKSAKSETVSAQARVLCFNDVMNRITIAAALKPVSNGERKIFLETLDILRKFEFPLLIFDRGFYSKELVEAMNKKDVFYLFRIKTNCQKNIDQANEPDQVITTNDGLKLRVINIILSTGEVEKLATNIFDNKFDVADFAEIYNKRWGVETSYLMVKERLAVENFTSAKENLILQDFYAAIATYNLMEIACMEQEVRRKESGADVGRQYQRNANRNIVAHEVRICLISVLLEENPAIIDRKMTRIQNTIYRFFKDIKPNRSNPRKTKFPHKKYHMNKKRN
ncbi:MAG: IS4 family transposase [Candidatus Bathyarchaeota archaeon]|nr:IS4 family transposase [Candidatus Termiticorpusculum sp.]